MYIFKSACTTNDNTRQFTQPDISFENPSFTPYDHFGESILQVKNTLLVGAPGYSTESKQRVGRIYAFDLQTKRLKWCITGTNEFQQFGK